MVREIRNRSLLKKISEHISDFKLFSFLAIFALIIGITFYLSSKPQEYRQRAFGTGMEFGFNTHLSSNGSLMLDQFKSSVDQIVSNNQKWVRFTIIGSDIAQAAPTSTSGLTLTPTQPLTPTPNSIVLGISTNTIEWNTNNLAVYDQAIDYASSRGLKIFLSSRTPDFAKDFSLTDFETVTDQYFRFLAQRYAGKIAIWEVFNNANIIDFKNQAPLGSLDSSYLSDFGNVLIVAKNAIKSNDSVTLVTTSAGGNPMTDTLVSNWSMFLDAINPSLDLVSVEMYPNTDTVQIAKLSNIVEGFHSKYGKDVVVSGTGLCTQSGIYSEADQQNYVTQSVDNLKLSSAKLVMQYELVDQNPTDSTCAGSYGIVKTDGTHKSSYTAIVSVLEPLPTVTPTPIATDTPTPSPLPTATPIPQTKGFLNVYINPPDLISTTTVSIGRKTGIVLNSLGNINSALLEPGDYYISFTNPKEKGLRAPKTTAFSISIGHTTTVIGDFTSGKTAVTNN